MWSVTSTRPQYHFSQLNEFDQTWKTLPLHSRLAQAIIRLRAEYTCSCMAVLCRSSCIYLQKNREFLELHASHNYCIRFSILQWSFNLIFNVGMVCCSMVYLYIYNYTQLLCSQRAYIFSTVTAHKLLILSALTYHVNLIKYHIYSQIFQRYEVHKRKLVLMNDCVAIAWMFEWIRDRTLSPALSSIHKTFIVLRSVSATAISIFWFWHRNRHLFLSGMYVLVLLSPRTLPLVFSHESIMSFLQSWLVDKRIQSLHSSEQASNLIQGR